MAERRSNPAMDGHEEFFDWQCGVCEGETGLMREAAAYCRHCGEGLCASCLPSHNRYNKTHSVLGASEKAEWGQSEATQEPLFDTGIECPDHRGQTVSMYCGRHSTLCCSVCAVLKHDDNCKSTLSYIPQISSGIRSSTEFHDTMSSLDDMLACLTDLEISHSDMLKSVKAEQEANIRNAMDFHLELTKRVEELKDVSVAEIERRYNKIEDTVQENIASCMKVRKELTDVKAEMQASSVTNDSLLFVRMKNCQQVISTHNKTSAKLRMKPTTTFSFEGNMSLMNAVKSFTRFGTLVGKTTKSTNVGNLMKIGDAAQMGCSRTSANASEPSNLPSHGPNDTGTEGTEPSMTEGDGKPEGRQVKYEASTGTLSHDDQKSSGSLQQTVPKYGPELAAILYLGARVMRGKDWIFGEQDQPGGVGDIIDLSSLDEGWVKVRWDNGKVGTYRMGRNGAYDLNFVPGSFNPPS